MITINDLIISSKNKDGLISLQEFKSIIDKKNKEILVNIKTTSFDNLKDWQMIDGIIKRKDDSFFSIVGLKEYENDNLICSQPIILQSEIGFLGYVCKKINGILYFLVQLKIEPGNINTIQISPTIQATKSNFLQKHGGLKPKYFEYFLHKEKYNVLIDQIQSEQNSRFLSKRNRNIIIEVEEELEIYDNFFFLTLGQIKELMKINNLVNMDSRTVLSCIPYIKFEKVDKNLFSDEFMYNSIYNSVEKTSYVFQLFNDFKMFSSYKRNVCKLQELTDWEIDKFSISKNDSNFNVIFCDIQIEGREVSFWNQPLFKSTGIGLFGLFRAKKDNKYVFLVKMKHECGIFDIVELSPTIQLEYQQIKNREFNEIEATFINKLESRENILIDVFLSEEGGRFYHEQNRNVIIEVDFDSVSLPSKDYIWLDYKTLSKLVLINNILNIQLRNLLSIIEVY